MREDQDFSAGKDFSHLAESPPRTAFPNTSAIASVTSAGEKTSVVSVFGVRCAYNSLKTHKNNNMLGTDTSVSLRSGNNFSCER